MLLCPRTSESDKLLSACFRPQHLPTSFTWQALTPVANAWSKDMQVHHACLWRLCPVGTTYSSMATTVYHWHSVCTGLICTLIWHNVCAPDSALPRIVPTCHEVRLRSFLEKPSWMSGTQDMQEVTRLWVCNILSPPWIDLSFFGCWFDNYFMN